MDMDIFATPAAGAEVETPIVNSEDDKKKAEEAKKRAEVREAMAAWEAEVPDLKDKIRSRSNDLEVVKCLVYTDGGSMEVDPQNPTKPSASKPGKTSPNLIPTPETVGYRVRNISNAPIPYRVAEYEVTGVESGAPVATLIGEVDKVLAAGEETILPRLYMSDLCARVEFSMTLANGKMVKTSNKKPIDIREKIIFKFDKETALSSTDDAVREQIAHKEGDKWIINPEYATVFGYLYNRDAEKPQRERKASSKGGYTTQDYLAAMVHAAARSK